MINSIDEAITRCYEKAEEKKKEADYFDAPYGMDTSTRTDCLERAKEYELFAGWLTELKQRRDNKGKWVMITVSDGKGGWERAPVCNRCACRKPDNIGQTFSNNFCPHCGAAMEKSENET